MRNILAEFDSGVFIETPINGSEEAIKNYYRIGTIFNVGCSDKDRAGRVTHMRFTDCAYTRQMHMNAPYSPHDAIQTKRHRDYYGQFVTPELIEAVEERIGLQRLRASVDKNLNDIALHRWDELSAYIGNDVKARMKTLGDSYSLGGGACIMKEAARQLIEKGGL